MPYPRPHTTLTFPYNRACSVEHRVKLTHLVLVPNLVKDALQLVSPSQ